ncbi:MAG: DUF2835 domain-containing protein [Chromatiaceae bacterium]|nr:DUF2835 domain-containing protein [Gammaproteobacteria bacterium]MCP5427879.1 DUF2835 domain-containing protein [Chromatiaceae bacterium]MCB1860930.1 DUF2835 domain-containing protein [Gammaproteobacteria bacterium]MCB1872600.1 DUF2835 domain-containing protein [Gammaproteobacteria bacterium]MCB1880180.1 DUF2835 domain-containing protein [Gammaproteobacteria bacterium]
MIWRKTSSIKFSIALSADRFLHYYRGNARSVIVRADDGRRIRLPAANLRPFLLSDGINGEFELTLDENNKLLDIRRL